MQNSRMLQARYRYLRARRDLEYEKLKEEERSAELVKELEAEAAALIPEKSLGAPGVVEMKNTLSTNSLACSSCGREFLKSAGLTSHMRHKTCEKIKD